MLDIKYLIPKIKPCEDCIKILFEGAQNFQHILLLLKRCPNCVSWDFDNHKHFLCFPPLVKYPNDSGFLINGFLAPKKQTYEQLINTVYTVHNNCINQRWILGELEAYMRTEDINDITQKSILHNAANCIAEQSVDQDIDLNTYNAILQKKNWILICLRNRHVLHELQNLMFGNTLRQLYIFFFMEL